MTALKPTMNLMALLKAGATIEIDPGLRFFYHKNIIIQRLMKPGRNWKWIHTAEYPLTKAGLEQAVEYINLPF